MESKRFGEEGTKTQAQRTTKVQPKLVLFPEDEGEIKSSPSGDLRRGGPAGIVLLGDGIFEGSSSATVDEGAVGNSLSLAEKEALPRVTAYCVAEGYRMDAVMQHLQSRHKVSPRVYDEVMHVRYDERQKSRAISSHKEGIRMMPSLLDYHTTPFSNRPTTFGNVGSIGGSSGKREACGEGDLDGSGFQTYADERKLFRSSDCAEEDEDAIVQRNPWAFSDVFIFDYGVLVFWNFTEAEELVLLHRMQRFCLRPLSTKDIEIENLHCTLETAAYNTSRGPLSRRKKKEKKERGLSSKFPGPSANWTSASGGPRLQATSTTYRKRSFGSNGDRSGAWLIGGKDSGALPTYGESTPLLAQNVDSSGFCQGRSDFADNNADGVLPQSSSDLEKPIASSNESLNKPYFEEPYDNIGHPNAPQSSVPQNHIVTDMNEDFKTARENCPPNTSHATAVEFDGLYTSKIVNDVIHLGSPSAMIKLTISHVLGQSVKLTFYENEMDLTIENTKQLPARLATLGLVKLSRRQITKIMGELYKLRMGVNLVSNVLDTPEWFWTERDSKSLYDSVRNYLEIQQRVELLNVRTKVLSDLLDMLSDHLHSAAAIWSTWMIIILIVIAIVVALAEIAVKAMGFTKHTVVSTLNFHPSVKVFKFILQK